MHKNQEKNLSLKIFISQRLQFFLLQKGLPEKLRFFFSNIVSFLTRKFDCKYYLTSFHFINRENYVYFQHRSYSFQRLVRNKPRSGLEGINKVTVTIGLYVLSRVICRANITQVQNVKRLFVAIYRRSFNRPEFHQINNNDKKLLKFFFFFTS